MWAISVSADDEAALTKSHPALIDSVVRWRGVGGWGATATIMRAIGVGAVSVGAQEGSVSLELVTGVATPKHPHPSGPFIERGHVEGLSSFDRQLLAMLFDHIAHAPVTDIARISDFRRAHPLEFWARLKEWREAVDAEALRLRSCGRLPVTRKLVDECRRGLVDSLYDESLSNREWSRTAEVALVANLDDVVAKSAAGRREPHSASHLTGPSAVVWLACLRSGRRTGLDVLRRLFSPLRPASYAPAQYTILTLAPHQRPRFVDDGSLRLGG